MTWLHKFVGCFLFQLTAEPNRPNSWFRQCCHSTPYIFHDQDVNMWLAKKQQGLNEGGLFQVFLEIILSMNTTQKFLGCTSLVYSFALATRLQPFKMFTKVSPYNCFSICLDSCRHTPACYLVDVLWCQPIKLIQNVSTAEFHEYWWNDIDLIFLSPPFSAGPQKPRTSTASKIKCEKFWPKI